MFGLWIERKPVVRGQSHAPYLTGDEEQQLPTQTGPVGISRQDLRAAEGVKHLASSDMQQCWLSLALIDAHYKTEEVSSCFED